jgi:hypothetical protein
MSDLPNVNDQNDDVEELEDDDVEAHKMTHGVGPGFRTGPEGGPGFATGPEGGGAQAADGEEF